jgi:capsular polysaccharide transport system permease protein
MRINRLFLFTVILPTFIAIIYFGLIMSDVFISESRFVVRSPERQTSAVGLGMLLKGAGFSRSQDDTYTVHDFMHSRDALAKINEKLPLDESFGGKHIDLISRFNGFGIDDSFEELFRYYQKRISIDLDTTSSISTLKVMGFNAEDVYRINTMLLEMGEHLINLLNERGRQDMIRFAASEVENAEQKVKDAGLALSKYRNKKTVFDPERQSALQLQLISKLQDQLISTKTQLNQVQSFTPNNPQIPALQKRAASLQTEIDEQMAKVAGGSASFTNKTAEYDRLTLDRVFADKQLATALISLEQARNEAVRKQLYLERIVQPNKPDVAIEPRRLRAILATFVLGLISWGILTILITGVREHRD